MKFSADFPFPRFSHNQKKQKKNNFKVFKTVWKTKQTKKHKQLKKIKIFSVKSNFLFEHFSTIRAAKLAF